MGFQLHADVADAALAHLRAHARRLILCSAEPASHAEAMGALRLGDVGIGLADLALGPGPSGGRRLTIAARSLTTIAAGTANHLVLADPIGGRVLHVAPCGAVPLLSGRVVHVGSWTLDLGAPA